MLYPINPLTAAEIVSATGGELTSGNPKSDVCAISCDSRTVNSNTLYIPLIGERFDGHSFLPQVCASGIGGYLYSSDCEFDAPFSIRVKDTAKALLDIAAYYRSTFSLPVVGLTGSVGKTTTKELIASVLSQKYNTLATKGNFNNNIGVPYTIFGINSTHNAAVIEMGMSSFGEIEVLSKCAKPDIAVITNIGTSHIEFLGSQEGILKAKCEIFAGLSSGGRVVLNGDDPYLDSLRGKLPYEVCFVGMKDDRCDCLAKDIKSGENGCSFTVDGDSYSINLAGAHNIYNALCAIAVGRMLGMNYAEINAGLRSYHPDGIRQNIISTGGYKVINDCYNSSPQSAIAALNVLSQVSSKRKIAVLGDIAELGDMTEKLHREVGEAVEKSDVDVLVAVGASAGFIAEEAKSKEVYTFPDSESAVAFVKDFVRENDAVLVKGSRCMKMEKISELLV